jgi:hypothetical protein
VSVWVLLDGMIGLNGELKKKGRKKEQWMDATFWMVKSVMSGWSFILPPKMGEKGTYEARAAETGMYE